MQTVALSAVPNQTFSTTLNGNRYDFAIYLCNGSMCCDVSVNEVTAVSGQRICNGTFMIPFFAYSIPNGNFLLLTTNDDLPDYTQFGNTQTLIYLDEAEIQAAVNAAPTPQENLTAYALA
jgi:hypothetical protein